MGEQGEGDKGMGDKWGEVGGIGGATGGETGGGTLVPPPGLWTVAAHTVSG